MERAAAASGAVGVIVVRVVAAARGHLAGRGHVRRTRTRYMVSGGSESVIRAACHRVQVVAASMARERRRWRLEIEVLWQHGSAEAQPVHHTVHGFEGLALSSETAWAPPKRALFEHKLATRVDGPVVALTGPPEALGQLDETLVEREVVPYRVFPALIRATEKRETGLQELVDLA